MLYFVVHVFLYLFSLLGQGTEEEHGGENGDKEALRSRGRYRAGQPREAHVPLAVQDFPAQRAHGRELTVRLFWDRDMTTEI